MKKVRLLYPITLLVIIAAIFIMTESGESQYPCFHGYTYVDGQLRDNVDVYLQIEGEDPMHVTSSNGYYSIGTSGMTGDYCLRGRYDDSDPLKGDTHQGTKGIASIRKDLYLTGTFSECEHTE
ncbi:MAG: hypothetical protein GF307_03420 [candidate division Zixibacteria bacterium]|nr:hypothetical protein [candidate division Zixibacteria bacterium]